MKNGMAKVLVLVAGMVLMSGCVDRSTPERTLRTAGAAAIKGDLKVFSSSLSPKMQEVFGNIQTMNKLGDELRVFNDFVFANQTLIDSREDYDHYYATYTIDVHGVDAQDLTSPLFHATIFCDTVTSEYGGGQGNPHTTKITNCLITGFEQ